MCLLCTQIYSLWTWSQEQQWEILSWSARVFWFTVSWLAQDFAGWSPLQSPVSCGAVYMETPEDDIRHFVQELPFFSDPTGFFYSCLSCNLPKFVYNHVAVGEILSNGLLSSLHLPRWNKHNVASFGGKRIWLLNSKTLLLYILFRPHCCHAVDSGLANKTVCGSKEWFSILCSNTASFMVYVQKMLTLIPTWFSRTHNHNLQMESLILLFLVKSGKTVHPFFLDNDFQKLERLWKKIKLEVGHEL